MCHQPIYFSDDPSAGNNSAARRLISSDSRGIDACNMFEYLPGVGYGMDEVQIVASFVVYAFGQ
jgi:hypothetical protein